VGDMALAGDVALAGDMAPGTPDDNKPVWPTWVVGVLSRGVRRIHINHRCFHIIPRHIEKETL
jgi:hypothetical protein